MDTVQSVFNDLKRLDKYTNHVKSINHIDDDIHASRNIWNILMSACMNGYPDIVKRCISLGADVNKLDYHDTPPLYMGLQYCNNKNNIAQILLQAGANPNIIVKGAPILFYVFWRDENVKNVDLLIRYGALTNEFYKYRHFLTENKQKYFIKILSKRRWVYIKCVMLILSVHKRAVERVNHPDRLKLLGTFEDI